MSRGVCFFVSFGNDVIAVRTHAATGNRTVSSCVELRAGKRMGCQTTSENKFYGAKLFTFIHDRYVEGTGVPKYDVANATQAYSGRSPTANAGRKVKNCL